MSASRDFTVHYNNAYGIGVTGRQPVFLRRDYILLLNGRFQDLYWGGWARGIGVKVLVLQITGYQFSNRILCGAFSSKVFSSLLSPVVDWKGERFSKESVLTSANPKRTLSAQETKQRKAFSFVISSLINSMEAWQSFKLSIINSFT